MDQVAPQFRAIASRRQAIAHEIAKLSADIQALETERTELEVAAKVLHRLGLLVDETGPELPLSEPQKSKQRPTVPDMIRSAVSGFHEAGLAGATAQQIVGELTRRWGVSDGNIIRPTLWRMMKDNRLARIGDIYQLPGVTINSGDVLCMVPRLVPPADGQQQQVNGQDIAAE